MADFDSEFFIDYSSLDDFQRQLIDRKQQVNSCFWKCWKWKVLDSSSQSKTNSSTWRKLYNYCIYKILAEIF